MADVAEAVSPRQIAPTMNVDNAMDSSPVATRSVNNALNSINMRADPDAQATVTDFLDFTEYLPSDMIRSLTLIGKLDQNYTDASTNIHELTTKWGRLPQISPEERPSAAQLRADISENLGNAVSARIFSHAEASRMAENVNQHYNRAKSILTKLQSMLQNWPPPEEQNSPIATRSPQMTRTPKVTIRGADGQRVRRPQVPRITVPGEVLAPYELNYDQYSDSSESEPDEVLEPGSPEAPTITPAPPSRIKVVRKERPPKTPKVPKTPRPRYSLVIPPGVGPDGITPTGPSSRPLSTSLALARLQPPPENAVKGSSDAPWRRLTLYELAKLRKRMKKNAAWTPSDTMIAKELKILGRGTEEYLAAKKKAEEDGVPFLDEAPNMVVDPETGAETLPGAALSQEALAAEERKMENPNNVRKRQSIARKPKGTPLPLSAAEEAEESARKMIELARGLMATPAQPPVLPDATSQAKTDPKRSRQKKRKRDSVSEADAEKPDSLEVPGQRPQVKRTKTETPVPHPQRLSGSGSQLAQETPIHPPHLVANSTVVVPRTTPVPLPIAGQDQATKAQSAASPASSVNTAVSNAVTASSTTARPHTETPIPPPVPAEKNPSTPIPPPIRETRKSQAVRKHEEQQQHQQAAAAKSSSRSATPAPAALPATEQETSAPATVTQAASTGPVTRRPTSRGHERRPASRGLKAGSQELEQSSSLASDRPRRASTARNTPAPAEKEPARPASRRSKRPAPGVISRTNSGGNSAVGKRKAAPKKKTAAAARGGATRKDKAAVITDSGVAAEGEVEIDDEGNVIDPNETRYCLCNRVSFGTMIQCDNADVSANFLPFETPIRPKSVCTGTRH